MPGPTPSTSESVTRTELPKWINKASKSNWDMAKGIDPQVADFSPTTTQAFQFFKDNLGAGSDDAAAASSIFRQMADPNTFTGAAKAGGIFSQLADPNEFTGGAKANDIYRRMADPGSLQQEIGGYLNPYISNVESKSLAALDDSRVRALMGNADNAAKAKSFGGSRAAVVDAVTNAETAKDAGLLSAQLRSQGYSDAVGNRRADLTGAASGYLNTDEAKRGRLSTAAQGYLAGDEAKRAALTAAGQGSLATADQKQAAMLKQFQGLSGIGAQEMDLAQKKLNLPIDKLNLRLAALGMTPYETSSTTNTTGTSGSPGFDWGSGIFGGLSLLAGLL